MDHRDMLAALGNGRGSFDPARMTLTIEACGEDGDGDYTETITVPAVYAVCPSCEGRGSYVNPSIDAHGISAEEMHEDPDFADDYMSGTYDVTCRDCNGARVVPEPAIDRMSPELVATLQSHEDFTRRSRAERAAELRYGY